MKLKSNDSLKNTLGKENAQRQTKQWKMKKFFLKNLSIVVIA